MLSVVDIIRLLMILVSLYVSVLFFYSLFSDRHFSYDEEYDYTQHYHS